MTRLAACLSLTTNANHLGDPTNRLAGLNPETDSATLFVFSRLDDKGGADGAMNVASELGRG